MGKSAARFPAGREKLDLKYQVLRLAEDQGGDQADSYAGGGAGEAEDGEVPGDLVDAGDEKWPR